MEIRDTNLYIRTFPHKIGRIELPGACLRDPYMVIRTRTLTVAANGSWHFKILVQAPPYPPPPLPPR